MYIDSEWIKNEIIDYVLTLDEGYLRRQPKGVREWMEIMLNHLIREARMNKKQKPTNVELVMSVGGIRDLVWWLTDYQKIRSEDTIPSEKTLPDYIDFLKSVLEGRDEQN